MAARTQGAHHAGLIVIPSFMRRVVRSIAIVGVLAVTGVVTVSGQPARAVNPERALRWINEGKLTLTEEYPQPEGCWSGAGTPSIDLQTAIFWHRSAVASETWPWGALSASPCWLVPGQ